MSKTMKLRKGPSSSATKFGVGTKMKGNDGNMWIIIMTSSGVHRWKKIGKTKKISKTKKIWKKKTTEKTTDVSTDILKQMKKKYNVAVSGSKKDIASGLWRVAGSKMVDKDLLLISYLLPKKEQKVLEKKVKVRMDEPIIDYKGLWKPLSKPLNKMSREELIRDLRSYRNAWERITTRHQDLDDERLKNETTEDLRGLLKFYYSNDSKLIAEDWIRK